MSHARELPVWHWHTVSYDQSTVQMLYTSHPRPLRHVSPPRPQHAPIRVQLFSLATPPTVIRSSQTADGPRAALCQSKSELSIGPFCATRPNPTHQLTDPTQPIQVKQEAQLSPRDRAMRRVN